MRVQTEEWRRFIPGVRMYKGKKTLFYNGEILWDEENHEYRIYSKEEQLTLEVIIVLPGVEIIPAYNFAELDRIETVIMSDSVTRIQGCAFYCCESLEVVRLSRNLEYIGAKAFEKCKSLPSIFIPPSCRVIGHWAFDGCEQLIIFVVPTDTRLDGQVIVKTALIYASPFETDEDGGYRDVNDEVNQWIKNINGDTDEFALHRACSSYNPIIEIIHEIVTRQGPQAFHTKNELGITPLQYLAANPFAEDIDQRALVKRYVFEMMGEVVY